ncbi:MAG: hypothetical protein ACKV19_06130 [Verrucomicrobiales bacterium]
MTRVPEGARQKPPHSAFLGVGVPAEEPESSASPEAEPPNPSTLAFPLKCGHIIAMAIPTTIQAELPAALVVQAHAYIEEGWATSFNELLADALRRYLESHSGRLTEAMILNDVRWGLHGPDRPRNAGLESDLIGP